jgi:hypothetical protein
MNDLRFHLSGARFRSFSVRFCAYQGKERLCFLAVSPSFPATPVRFLFPAYIRATGNEGHFTARTVRKRELNTCPDSAERGFDLI